MLANLKFIFGFYQFLMEISRKYNQLLTTLRESFLFLASLFIICIPKVMQAQHESEKDLILLTGRVMENERKRPVPDVQIISKNNLVGTFSNLNGYFEILITPNDSLQFTSLGFATTVFAVTDSMLALDHPSQFNLPVDTIEMHEVIIRGFPSYQMFKQQIANMKPQDRPWDLTQYMKDNPLLYLQPNTGYSTTGPVQMLYNYFNSEATLQRQLIRNRKKFNRNMIKLGRVKDTISATPDYMQEKLR